MISLKVDQDKNEFFPTPGGEFLMRLSIFDFPQSIDIIETEDVHKVVINYIDKEEITDTLLSDRYALNIDDRQSIREIIILAGELENLKNDFIHLKIEKQLEAIKSTYVDYLKKKE